MKKTMTRWMIAAAAVAAVAGTAAAQTYKAEIPLSFQVGTKAMMPGSYQVTIATGSNPLVRVYNADTHASAILVGGPNSDVAKQWRNEGKPVLIFECAGRTCALRKLWDGQNPFAYQFTRPRGLSGELRTEVVRMGPMKAD